VSVAERTDEVIRETGTRRIVLLAYAQMNLLDLSGPLQTLVTANRARAVGEAARYETLVASLAKQVPKVLEQPGAKGVKFDVAIRDGKPVLKATPTK